MKKIIQIVGLIIITMGQITCRKVDVGEVSFKDQDKFSMYSYLVAHKDTFSSFLSIVEKGGIDKILSAYNPSINGPGYTLFLPDNNAINTLIQESGKYTSLADLLNDAAYVSALCRYHVLTAAHKTDDFPYGFFKELTLSDDQLAVNIPKDGAYFLINNQAPIVRTNIKVSNGYIHIIGKSLKPITYTTYGWLEQNSGYSIFKAAVDITGLKALLDLNIKTNTLGATPFTLLVEADSVYNKRKIYSISDLENLVSPNNTDYTNPSNSLHSFVTYHLLIGSKGLNDFATQYNVSERNYETYSDIPLKITDLGLFCVINKGSTVFDTLVHNSDTTIINYIGFNYDASNILSQSGSINNIDQVLTKVRPIQTRVDFQFLDGEPIFQKMSQVPGSHIIEDSSALKTLKWTGPDMYFVTGDNSSQAWNGDYLMINNGDFSLKYITPKIIQGTYDVWLRANGTNSQNALMMHFYKESLAPLIFPHMISILLK